MACAVDGGELRFLAALPLVLAAGAFALRGLIRAPLPASPAPPESLWALLGATTVLGTVTTGSGGPTWFEIARRSWWGAAVVLVAVAASTSARRRQRAVQIAVIGTTAIVAATPYLIPDPQIDVMAWTAAASRALAGAVHPYTVQPPDVYHGGSDFGFDVLVYPYMPATLVVFAPVMAALGDFRYALAACVPLSVWLVRRAGRAGRVDPALLDLATLALVLNPVIVRVVRSGWSEPLLIAATAAFGLAVQRGMRAMPTVCLLMLPTVKQYVLAPTILWAAVTRTSVRRRDWIVAGAAAAATVLPFLLWNPQATLAGMLFQMRAPLHPRLASISIPGLLANVADWNVPIWLSAIAQLGVSAVLAASGLVREPAGVLLGGAIALLTTFVLGWQAFVNYYTFVAGLLVIAATLDNAEASA
jgi:hypothetical protein